MYFFFQIKLSFTSSKDICLNLSFETCKKYNKPKQKTQCGEISIAYPQSKFTFNSNGRHHFEHTFKTMTPWIFEVDIGRPRIGELWSTKEFLTCTKSEKNLHGLPFKHWDNFSRIKYPSRTQNLLTQSKHQHDTLTQNQRTLYGLYALPSLSSAGDLRKATKQNRRNLNQRKREKRERK